MVIKYQVLDGSSSHKMDQWWKWISELLNPHRPNLSSNPKCHTIRNWFLSWWPAIVEKFQQNASEFLYSTQIFTQKWMEPGVNSHPDHIMMYNSPFACTIINADHLRFFKYSPNHIIVPWFLWFCIVYSFCKCHLVIIDTDRILLAYVGY